MALSATTGTNTLIYGNLIAGIGTILAEWLTPDLITSLLGSKYGFLAPLVMLLINWLGHGMTGNSATSVLPGVVAPSAPTVGAAGG